MGYTDLEQNVLDSLKIYWRIQVALAAMEVRRGEWKHMQLRFENVPQQGLATGYLQNETVDQSIGEIKKYSSTRFLNDIYLLMISHLEQYLSNFLLTNGQPSEGTFGQIQKSAETFKGLNSTKIFLVDEIRERRNAIIHHHGKVTDKYIVAATAAIPYATVLSDPHIMTDVNTDAKYLTHVADTILSYGKLF